MPESDRFVIEIRGKFQENFRTYLILLISAVLLVSITGLSLQGLVHDTIRRDAEHRAARWADSFVAQVPEFLQISETGIVSIAQHTAIEAAIEAMVADAGVFRFKLFSPNGEVIFVSDQARFGQSDGDTHRATAIRVFAELENDISVRNGRSDPSRPDTYVEAYLPAMSSSHGAFGVIEVYVDVTMLANILRNRFYFLGTSLILFCTIAFFVLAVVLIRKRRQIENAQTREAWLAAILYNAPFEVVIKDTKGKIRAISRNVVEEFKMADADFFGKTTADFLPANTASKYMDADREVVRSGKASQIEVLEIVEGQTRSSLCSKFPLIDAQGRTTGICSITNDITDMKASEAALAQAQKMEAVGQLTGGIAHDFNNLLAIIMWSAEEIQSKLEPEDNCAGLIIQTAKKGAFLTQQLLSFSRKQNLTPQSVDVEKLILRLSQLLGRTLGETIEVSTEFNPDLINALVDSNQLENAVLNLALNARDAMPKGGTLNIACSAVAASEVPAISQVERKSDVYVVMTISDNGVGMSADVLDHVFEPFYTTKDVGRGSGLGLSMVYGFAQQSNGHVSVESNPGVGTTISLYLPSAGPQSLQQNKAIKDQKPLTQKLQVLLLEDDLQVRELAQKRLEAMGHNVLAFGCVSDARGALSTETKIDLLLTDVVLPGGVSGPDFALEIRERYTDVRVLLMSGYSSAFLETTDLRTEELIILPKPFNSKSLEVALIEAMS